MLSRFFNNRNSLGLLFMLPTAVLLLVFLTYPLGLGVWLGFTDTKIGGSGKFIGLGNYSYLVGDSLTQLSLFAQELKTPMPISARRLQKVWEALQR